MRSDKIAANLSVMLRLIGRAITIAALCGAIGLHWAAMQSVAWAMMLVQNSKSAPLAEALAKTLDGQHPCSLCHAVQKGKSSEKKSDLQVVSAKIDLICAAKSISLVPPFEFISYVSSARDVRARVDTPAVPPPRVTLG